MAGNDQPGNEKQPSAPPLSLDDADRLASQFTAMWDEPAFAEAAVAPAAPPVLVAPPPVTIEPAPPPARAPAPARELTPDVAAQYAPPRPLVSPEKSLHSVAPASSVEVEPVQTPSGANRARPGLAPNVLAFEEEEPIAARRTEPPRSRRASGRGRGVVFGVVGVAAGLIVAGVARTALRPADSASTPAPRTETVAPVVTQPPAQTAAAPAPPPLPETALPAPAPTPPPPSVTAEPTAAETAETAETAKLDDETAAAAAKRPENERHHLPPARAARVERHTVEHPAHHATTAHPPSSTPAGSGGTIVRESPF